ncbi:hypothetical protein UY3_03658 [Chelonia mydas]|uniref:Uncharacterized protein n=1 Tax=Chelonia mydas TaxID=8469 RepID=M7C3Y9_CHEMY|nr:hypothetical protein UY3_03658 [Chelonia mydas]
MGACDSPTAKGGPELCRRNLLDRGLFSTTADALALSPGLITALPCRAAGAAGAALEKKAVFDNAALAHTNAFQLVSLGPWWRLCCPGQLVAVSYCQELIVMCPA